MEQQENMLTTLCLHEAVDTGLGIYYVNGIKHKITIILHKDQALVTTSLLILVRKISRLPDGVGIVACILGGST